jgi:hypothetical protein
METSGDGRRFIIVGDPKHDEYVHRYLVPSTLPIPNLKQRDLVLVGYQDDNALTSNTSVATALSRYQGGLSL